MYVKIIELPITIKSWFLYASKYVAICSYKMLLLVSVIFLRSEMSCHHIQFLLRFSGYATYGLLIVIPSFERINVPVNINQSKHINLVL